MYHTPSAGKGDKPRPMKISTDEFGERWDSIFSKSKKKEKKPSECLKTTEVSSSLEPV